MRQNAFRGNRKLAALLLAVLLPGAATLAAQQAPPPPPPPDQTLSPDQLNDLVAPIALYPDPLLSQVMVAATYPLEVVQAFQWLQKNPGLSGPALTAGRATAELGSERAGAGGFPRCAEAFE